MKYTHIRKMLGLTAMVISASMLLASCSLFGGDTSSKTDKEIESVVTDFLETIEDGSFAEDEFESDYLTDTSFLDLKFSDKAAEDFMIAGMEEISFEIDKAKGDEDDEEGFCDIVLTALDIESIMDDLDDDYDAEVLEEAMGDKDAPTEEYEITLDLEYDDDEEEWLISDLSELVEILGDPYTEIKFASDDPAGVAEDFLAAFISGDFDMLSDLSDGYFVESDFVDPASTVASQLFAAVFGEMTYVIGDPVDSTDTYASFDIDFSYPDYVSASESVTMDIPMMSEAVKPVVYSIATEDSGDDSIYYEYLDEVALAIIDELSSSSATGDDYGTIELYFDSNLDSWVVDSIPNIFYTFSDLFYNFDPLDYAEDSLINEIVMDSLEMLLADGSITQAQYDNVAAQFGEGPEPTGDYTAAEVIAAIDSQGWFDWNVYEYVTEYSVGVYSLDYDLYFTQSLAGLILVYSFYGDSGVELLFSQEITLGVDEDIADEDSCYFVYYQEDYSELPADQYSIVVTMLDGTVIAESSISVS